MRWPDIFFKARSVKPPETKSLPPADISPIEPVRESEVAEADSSRRLPVSQVVLPPAPIHTLSSDREVMKEMAEADTLRELSRSGGVRLVKRDFSLSPAASSTGASTAPKNTEVPPPAEPLPPPPMNPSFPESAEAAPAVNESPSTPISPDAKKSTGAVRSSPAINLSTNREPVTGNVYPSAMTIFRRRTKMADVARIVLPPRREEASTASPVPPTTPPAAESAESSSTVIPPSFPIPISTGTVLQDNSTETKPVGETSPPEIESTSKAEETPSETPSPEAAPEKAADDAPKDSSSVPADSGSPSPVSESSHEEPAAPQASGVDSSPALPAERPPDTREKREFILSNGERILGHILSETPEAIYIDHGTLGVLTIPRAQIAQRPVEIILINGDRVVGDIIAETPDSLFVRHASLGILTVPRNQRSTRVVEAILKDGDRILGEVLGETENFTVIRSATLGTVAVPHNKVAMLNRRAEQVQMKALPAPSPELENKPASSS